LDAIVKKKKKKKKKKKRLASQIQSKKKKVGCFGYILPTNMPAVALMLSVNQVAANYN
jgi:hypothetical protein